MNYDYYCSFYTQTHYIAHKAHWASVRKAEKKEKLGKPIAMERICFSDHL